MIGREDVTPEGGRGNDEHEFSVVLDGLENDKLAVKEGQPVLADIITIGGVKGGDVRFGKRGGGR